MKQLFEFFPLIIFFAVYYKSDKDLYLSIAAVIIATLISLAALYDVGEHNYFSGLRWAKSFLKKRYLFQNETNDHQCTLCYCLNWKYFY